jgi:solute carrier family 6 GABA transporter-like protein 6/8/11/12/13
MDNESNNNDSGISDSISDESRENNTSVLLSKVHGNATHNKHGRQAVRKMSTMPEEEDIMSDDADPDVIKIGHQQQKCSEIEPGWTSEERSHLLNSAGRKIVIAPTTASNGNARRTFNRDDSTEIVQDRIHPRPQSRPLIADQIEFRSSPGRDNGPHSPGRLSVKNVDQHATRYYSNARSLRTPIIMNENQQQCPCCHQPPLTWASILYADSANEVQARTFPDTISIRSLASIGLGSSDGRKLTIRRVPTSPSELLNVVHPPP